MPQIEQLASMPGPPLPKVKGKNIAVCPDHPIVRSERDKVGESRTLARERRIRAGACRGHGVLHGEGRQVPKRKGKTSKENLPWGSRRMHEQVSGRKKSPGRSAESWFHFKFGQTEMKKEIWRRKAR